MSRKEKLKNRLLSVPSDFSYSELLILLKSFNYEEIGKGKTSGSRRAFFNERTKHIIRLHKPHPKPILKKYQIREIINELKKENWI